LNLKEYLTQEFLLLFLIVFVYSLVTLIIGITQGALVSMEQANQTVQEISTWSIAIEDIFINNALIVLITMTPVIGVIFSVSVMYNTGYVIGEIAKYNGLDNFNAIRIMLSNPILYIEITSISLVVAETTYLLYLFFFKHRGQFDELKERFKYSLISFFSAFGILFLGAVIEHTLISLGI